MHAKDSVDYQEKRSKGHQKVMKDLLLTKEEIILTFLKPKVSFQKYVRQIIYQMTKDDFDRLEKIIIFPSKSKTVKDKQKILSSFIRNLKI